MSNWRIKMNDSDLMDEGYVEQPKSQEQIEMDNIWKECNIPLENNITLDKVINKTIKFCDKTNNRKNNTVLFVFTDDTFLILKDSWNDITDSVPFCLEQEEAYQYLMVKGGLISQEKVDKYNEFWDKKREMAEKEQDIKILQSLLEKYPEYKNYE
jgi:hypothetical protein